MHVDQLAIASKCLKAVRKPLPGSSDYGGSRQKEFRYAIAKMSVIPAASRPRHRRLALQAAHHFAFGVRWILEVEAAHSALLMSQCLINLGERFIPTACSEFLGAIQTSEKTARIADWLTLNYR